MLKRSWSNCRNMHADFREILLSRYNYYDSPYVFRESICSDIAIAYINERLQESSHRQGCTKRISNYGWVL